MSATDSNEARPSERKKALGRACCIAAHHAASPCHAYAALRVSQIAIVSTPPTRLFLPALLLSLRHLLTLTGIPGAGLIMWRPGSPSTPKEMPGEVSPWGPLGHVQTMSLPMRRLRAEKGCRQRYLAPCRTHGRTECPAPCTQAANRSPHGSADCAVQFARQ